MQFTVTDLDDIFSTARVDLIFSVRDPQLGNFALTRVMIGHQVTPSLGHSLALRYWPMLSRLFQRRGWPPGQVNHAQSYQIIRGWTLGTPQGGPVWSAVCLNLGDTRYPPFHGYVSTTPYECGTKSIWSSTKDFRAPNLEFSVAGTSIFFTGNLASEDPTAWLLDATSMIG